MTPRKLSLIWDEHVKEHCGGTAQATLDDVFPEGV